MLLRPFIIAGRLLYTRRHDKFRNYDMHTRAKRDAARRIPAARPAYLLVALLDYLPQVFFKVIVPKALGWHVICDRYYHDLMLDIVLTTGGGADRLSRLVRNVGALLPQPDLIYRVNISPAIAMQRKNDIPSVEQASELKHYYDVLAKTFAIPELDGTQPLPANAALILEDLKRIGRRHSRAS